MNHWEKVVVAQDRPISTTFSNTKEDNEIFNESALNFPTQKERARWNVSPERSQSQANQFDVTLAGIALWLFAYSLFIASF